MHSSPAWILTFAFTFTPLARADDAKLPLTYCEPAATIAGAVENCEQNDSFLQQGESCLDKLDGEARKSKDLLGSSAAKGTTSKQAAHLQDAAIDYGQASARLGYLIAITKLSIAQMDEYVATLEPPEDSDEPDVNGGSEQAYSMSVACYGDSTNSLRSLQEDFRDRLHQFEAAKRVVDANLGKSANGQADLKNGPTTPTAKASGAKEKKKTVPQGTDSAHQSSVTGVKEDERKQQQAPGH